MKRKLLLLLVFLLVILGCGPQTTIKTVQKMDWYRDARGYYHYTHVAEDGSVCEQFFFVEPGGKLECEWKFAEKAK